VSNIAHGKHPTWQTNQRAMVAISARGLWERAEMHPGYGKRKVATGIVATVVAVMLWGFGVEYVLHNYVFISPPENAVQKMK
jgi:hypothetical protein